ncbi:AraC family transcriptional regulator [Nesterenkonia muleiensis]|uniref:AraC family transcriptional regulator n=1 Tax=Nesterenkonia muleiensis TaxID=2282648 RepID=UPI000E726848|nr:helix-turn-helix domain-containing protein [Nesterenkonia muleiensis]
MEAQAERPIRGDEQTGVLHPDNLNRYDAHWIEPAPAVRDVVDQYWYVRWHMGEGEAIEQAIIDFPAVTLTVEQGEVPAGLVVTGLHRQAWHRRIVGTGEVFAIRLRPAGLAVLSALGPASLRDATVPLTPHLDGELYRLMTGIADRTSPAERAQAADELIAARLQLRPPRPTHLLANRIVDELRSGPAASTGRPLAARFGVSDRTIQRALAATLGSGPKQVARRMRLQQAAQAIAFRDEEDLAAIAAELGYADQAHLTTDFRTAAGTSPGAYRRALHQLAAG